MKTITLSENLYSFMKDLETAYIALFPEAFISAKYSTTLGLESVYLTFGVQDPLKHLNNIVMNDPALHRLMIYGVKDGDFTGAPLELDNAMGGSLLLKPAPDSYYAFDTVKFGFRKKKGSPEQMKKHLINYFKKMRKVVDDNRDQLAHEIV